MKNYARINLSYAPRINIIIKVFMLARIFLPNAQKISTITKTRKNVLTSQTSAQILKYIIIRFLSALKSRKLVLRMKNISRVIILAKIYQKHAKRMSSTSQMHINVGHLLRNVELISI